ncbi:MAG: hypothetical protein IPP35_12385 [Elusimicrobia bacterium]|nr:hypothetical protein [Elusimicrobiota bacterium]
MDRNAPAAEALRRGGVNVFYAQGPVLHAKALVVDGKTVLLGSTNWTSAALEKNVEADVLIRSTSVAKTLLARMADVSRRAPPDPFSGGIVPVPLGLLFPPGKLGKSFAGKTNGPWTFTCTSLKSACPRRALHRWMSRPLWRFWAPKDEGPVANRRRLHRVSVDCGTSTGFWTSVRFMGKTPPSGWRFPRLKGSSFRRTISSLDGTGGCPCPERRSCSWTSTIPPFRRSRPGGLSAGTRWRPAMASRLTR